MSAPGSPSPRRPSHRGFTLLECVVAMSILAMVMMAIFDLNAGAVRMHQYTKRVTVASLLAREKMTDIEQELYDEGFSPDDDEEEGDFSEEGWPGFKWRARILAPRTSGLTPEQLMGALFNIPMGGEEGGEGGAGGLAALFGGAAGGAAGASPSGGPTPDATGGIMGMLGPFASMAQGQFTQMVEQIAQSVREVHLTVSWKEGDTVESVDLVTHVVSQGPGGDRNGSAVAGAVAADGTPLDPAAAAAAAAAAQQQNAAQQTQGSGAKKLFGNQLLNSLPPNMRKFVPQTGR